MVSFACTLCSLQDLCGVSLRVALIAPHLALPGKCFPCDTCHDAAEDHPAVWANRMLCGFCGLEQPFSSKPCSCGSQLAKSSSMTRFWEGGKGNRNTRALSKNDSKKSVIIFLQSSSHTLTTSRAQVRRSQQNNIKTCRSPPRA